MRYACTPILVGVVSPVSEILLLPETIVHEGQKIELAKKFMQVEVDEICMCTMFGGLPNVGPGIMIIIIATVLTSPSLVDKTHKYFFPHPFPEHLVSYHNTTSCLLESCPSSPLIHQSSRATLLC